MTDIKQYLAWIKHNQQMNPEWKAANAWQNRNQTPPPADNKAEEKKDDVEEVEETPEE